MGLVAEAGMMFDRTELGFLAWRGVIRWLCARGYLFLTNGEVIIFDEHSTVRVNR